MSFLDFPFGNLDVVSISIGIIALSDCADFLALGFGVRLPLIACGASFAFNFSIALLYSLNCSGFIYPFVSSSVIVLLISSLSVGIFPIFLQFYLYVVFDSGVIFGSCRGCGCDCGCSCCSSSSIISSIFGSVVSSICGDDGI